MRQTLRRDGAGRKRLSGGRNRQRGQDLVEYALALPVILIFLMGILDLGRVVYVYNSLYNSVRDGARYGVIYPSDTAGIESLVRTKAVGLDWDELTITVAYPDADTIQVQAAYQFQAVTPLVTVLIGGSQWQLSTQSTMRVEG